MRCPVLLLAVAIALTTGGCDSQSPDGHKTGPAVLPIEKPEAQPVAEAPKAEAGGQEEAPDLKGLDAGKLAFEAKKFDEVVTILRETVVREPRNAEAFYYLGRAYHEKNMLDEAFAAYTSATKLDPKYMWPHYDMGRLYSDKERHDEAVVVLRNAVRLKPDYMWAHFLLGNSLKANNDLAGAVAALETARKLEPGNVHVLQMLAQTYVAKGDKVRAIQTYEAMAREAGDDEAREKVARDAIAELKDEKKPEEKPQGD